MVNYTPNSKNPDIVRWCDQSDGPTGTDTCIYRAGGFGGTISQLNMVLHTSRSHHPGGVTVAMADGSMQFITNAVDKTTWTALGTINEGEVIEAEEY